MEPDLNTQKTEKYCLYRDVDGGCDTRKLYPDQCYINRIAQGENLDLDQCPVRHEYDIFEKDIIPGIRNQNNHVNGILSLDKIPKPLNLDKILRTG